MLVIRPGVMQVCTFHLFFAYVSHLFKPFKTSFSLTKEQTLFIVERTWAQTICLLVDRGVKQIEVILSVKIAFGLCKIQWKVILNEKQVE